MKSRKILPTPNQPEDRMEYEKPELEEIELLDETAKGYSPEPDPPDSGGDDDKESKSFDWL
ncbi:MAG: hypothetical protein HQ591_04675 [candidate division Zixibacteria bacterium]|nr:hypothetical protein [Candidatus Tariuqbacter arcticus]